MSLSSGKKKTTVRILLAGGRYGASHIATHLNCLEGSVETLVLDGSHSSSKVYLKNHVRGEIQYEYVHMPDTGLIERIIRAEDYYRSYESTTLVGVDDLILDSEIFEVLRNTEDRGSQRSNQIILGFGPDLSYYPQTRSMKAEFFFMPRKTPIGGKAVNLITYWDKIRNILADPDDNRRLLRYFTETSFFPMVYATYDTHMLQAHLKAFELAISNIGLSINSPKAGILHEFSTVCAAIVFSPIYVTDGIYRLGNYSCNSMGGASGYCYRTILGSPSDAAETQLFFKSYAAYMKPFTNNCVDIAPLFFNLYIFLAMMSQYGLYTTDQEIMLLDHGGAYQRNERFDYACNFFDRASADRHLRFIRSWNEHAEA